MSWKNIEDGYELKSGSLCRFKYTMGLSTIENITEAIKALGPSNLWVTLKNYGKSEKDESVFIFDVLTEDGTYIKKATIHKNNFKSVEVYEQ